MALVARASDITAPSAGSRSSALDALGRVWRDQRANLTRTAAVLAALAGWEALVRSGTVSPLFLSSPSDVAARLIAMFSTGSIWPHIWASGQEALLGFGMALLVGLPLGVAMGRAALIRHTFEPFVVGLYSSPTVAFLPLLILWLGTGLWSKAVLVFVGVVAVLVVNTEAGIANVDPRLVEMGRAFTAGQRQLLTQIYVPAAAPYILAGLRLGIGRALIMVVVAELYASTAGLGNLIFSGAAKYDTAQVFAAAAIIIGLGIFANQALRAMERSIAPWREARDT